MDLRLALVDVECGARDQPLAERPRQRVFVDDRAARGVDENRRPLHPRQRALVDQVAGLRASRGTWSETMSDESRAARRARRATGPGRFGCSRPANTAVMPNAGALAATALPMRPPPMMPSCLPRSSMPSMKSSAQALPGARPHQPIALADTPRDAEDQRPRELRDRLGEHVGRVGDDDAARARGRRRRRCRSRRRCSRRPSARALRP